MGSEAYGAALSGGVSDIDVVGFAIPSKGDLFPYSHGGYIFGFGSNPQPFSVWTQHHVKDGDKEYDLTVYSIVKFFHLAMENNINILDCLFVPDRCVIHATALGKMGYV
jgi:predicted nucleotidyltransferase